VASVRDPHSHVEQLAVPQGAFPDGLLCPVRGRFDDISCQPRRQPGQPVRRRVGAQESGNVAMHPALHDLFSFQQIPCLHADRLLGHVDSGAHDGFPLRYPWNVRPSRYGRPVPMKISEIILLLERDGWRQKRVTGSHRHFTHPTKPGLVTVAGKPSATLKPKTESSILKQAGLRRERP
jgi:predicted RNA binding protein YcfA (HicA-like mRNA interferase family)